MVFRYVNLHPYNVAQVVFIGLNTVIPLITDELLTFPKLCRQYFQLLAGAEVQADPTLKAPCFQNFDCEMDNSAFNLNPVVFLSLHSYILAHMLEAYPVGRRQAQASRRP